jgi:hypothetical protein
MKKIKFSWSAYSAVAILLLWLVSSAQARIPQNAETFQKYFSIIYLNFYVKTTLGSEDGIRLLNTNFSIPVPELPAGIPPEV